MNFNQFLKSLFGDKSTRDMKLIQPLVEKVKEVSPQVEKLSNDELRARSKQIQQQVQDAAKEKKAKIAELKATIEDTPIDEREEIFNQIDKLDKEALDALPKTRKPSLQQQISTESWRPIPRKTLSPSTAIRLSIIITGLPAVMI